MIDKVIVIGISAGGRTALHFAKNYPDRLTKLILESAVICETWPDSGTRIGAMFLFNRFSERITWAIFRLLGRFAPDIALKSMMKSLSSLKFQEAVGCWDEKERKSVLEFLLGLRSGSGFLYDIKHTFAFDELNLITVPTLIIAGSNDKSVSPLNSIKASEQINGAQLRKTALLMKKDVKGL